MEVMHEFKEQQIVHEPLMIGNKQFLEIADFT